MKIRSSVGLAAVFSIGLAAQSPTVTPPRVLRAESPGLAPPTAVGGGQVILEVTVDPSGVPARVGLLRSTPPYSQMVIDAVSRWRFAPARSRTPDGEVAIQSSVIVTAVYRPPVLTNGPTLGETPKDVARGSGESPYPVGIVEPNYPPRAFTGGVIAYEVMLDEIGRIQNLRIVGEDPGFDAVAREALLQWKFRGGSVRGRPAPTSAYVIFAFSMPVVGAPGLLPQPRPAPK